MAELAQAYLHLKPYHASHAKLRALGKAADALSSDAAKRIYGGGVVVEIELEEGSLIVRVTVVGLLAGHLALNAYGTIADYKGFKESIVELCNDAKEFAVDVCEPFQKKAGVTSDQVFRFERRLKTPGRLSRLARRLQRLESSVNDLSSKAMQAELSEARRELSRIADDLTIEDLKIVEAAISNSELPPPSQWPHSKPELPKIARKDELQLEFDSGLRPGELPPVSNDRTPRLVYRNRIRVEEQLPGFDPQKARETLPLAPHLARE